MTAQRSELEVYACILEKCRTVPQLPGWLYRSIGSHGTKKGNSLKQYLTSLSHAGLLEPVKLTQKRRGNCKGIAYLTTVKGREWLVKFYFVMETAGFQTAQVELVKT